MSGTRDSGDEKNEATDIWSGTSSVAVWLPISNLERSIKCWSVFQRKAACSHLCLRVKAQSRERTPGPGKTLVERPSVDHFQLQMPSRAYQWPGFLTLVRPSFLLELSHSPEANTQMIFSDLPSACQLSGSENIQACAEVQKRSNAGCPGQQE